MSHDMQTISNIASTKPMELLLYESGKLYWIRVYNTLCSQRKYYTSDQFGNLAWVIGTDYSTKW